MTAAEMAARVAKIERLTGVRDEPVSTGAVSTAGLLDEVVQVLKRFVVFSNEHQAIAVALWVLHTYIFEECETTPYLHVKSATKQSGKTRLFEVLALIAAGAWSAVEASEAALFRTIDKRRPTLLLDEIDAAFGKDPTMTQGIRGLLNAGYRKHATVPRCVGNDFAVADFKVYCPKAFAGIGDRLPDTVTDRSIPIELKRRAPGERTPERFRFARAKADLVPLAARLTAWGAEHAKAIGASEPEMLEALSDRQQDCWESLFAIAGLAGGQWPHRAEQAALALHGGVQDQDAGMLLLAHVRDAFDELKVDALATEHLLDHLMDRGDDSPWARWWSDDLERGHTKGPGSKVARMLKPFGIVPSQLWIDQAKHRGYKRSDFADAWERYLVATVSPPDRNGRTQVRADFRVRRPSGEKCH